MLHREGEAMRTREWGTAWSTTAGDRGCWLVAAGHKLMKLLWDFVFACEGALGKDLGCM